MELGQITNVHFSDSIMINKFSSYKHIATSLGAAALMSVVILSPVAAAALTNEQARAVSAVTQYLTAIKTLKGKFTQIGPRGRVSSGAFFIAKPGLMRFEYSPPNPLLIVSDGTWVTVKNRKRNRADQYPLSATPLRLILSRKVNFTKEVAIKGIQQENSKTHIKIEDKSTFASGTLILTFDNEKQALTNWVVVDDRGRRTTVALSELEKGAKIDPALFKVKIPKSRSEQRLEDGTR